MNKVQEDRLQGEKLVVNESIFALGNGYIGIRGNFEEGYPVGIPSIRGTYINAFHDIIDVHYPEKAYAFPEKAQRLVNIVDAQSLVIELENGEIVTPFNELTQDYQRALDLTGGYLTRTFVFETQDHRSLRVTFRRLVSFKIKELFVTELMLEPISYFGKVIVRSTLNGDIENYTEKDDPRVASGHAKHLRVIQVSAEPYLSVEVQANQSGLISACSSTIRAEVGDSPLTVEHEAYQQEAEASYQWELKEKSTLTKYVVYTDSLRHLDPLKESLEILGDCAARSFEKWLSYQRRYLDEFWQWADITIKGDEPLQDGLRFNVFHLLQSVGKDEFSNIAAKGLTGEGYEGHYFWDTEIFVLPVFILTNPPIAKSLLRYRYHILENARERAKEMGHSQGALFPWRTISGTECSAYFPAGTAQYHISGDIAYAFVSYYLATGDLEFMLECGAEVLVETARLWLDVCHMKDGRFCIDCVTGPDEYTAIVNNNYYTNAIAKYNLYWANKIYFELEKVYDKEVRVLAESIRLTSDELAEFREISNRMYLPYDAKLDLNPQDDHFLSKKVWDFEGTDSSKYPLLLNYHPLTIYRHQVLKQADVSLAHYLLEDYATESTIRNSYIYYEKLTTHDSSLSYCISSIMACKLGDRQKAYEYFMETARLDLDNTHNNTKDGLHMANMGGSYMGIVYGFAGLRLKESGLYLNPVYCDHWEEYAFNIRYHERVIHIAINEKTVRIRVEGEPLKICVYGVWHDLIDVLIMDTKK